MEIASILNINKGKPQLHQQEIILIITNYKTTYICVHDCSVRVQCVKFNFNWLCASDRLYHDGEGCQYQRVWLNFFKRHQEPMLLVRRGFELIYSLQRRGQQHILDGRICVFVNHSDEIHVFVPIQHFLFAAWKTR